MLSSRMNLNIRRQIGNTFPHLVAVIVPLVTTAGHDAFTGAPSDITEQDSEQWQVSYVQARVQHPDHMRVVNFKGIVASGDLGDIIVEVSPRQEALLQRAKNSKGFLLIEGDKYRIDSITPNRVEAVTSLVVTGNLL